MKRVYLSDFAYPCVAYVIRRLGLRHNVEEILDRKGSQYIKGELLKPGDVVIWERVSGSEITDATLVIDKHGPVTTKLHLGKHYGVYEGNGLVSDLCFDGNTYFPRIRLMRLNDHPAPREILPLECLEMPHA